MAKMPVQRHMCSGVSGWRDDFPAPAPAVPAPRSRPAHRSPGHHRPGGAQGQSAHGTPPKLLALRKMRAVGHSPHSQSEGTGAGTRPEVPPFSERLWRRVIFAGGGIPSARVRDR